MYARYETILTLFLIIISLGGVVASATNYTAWSSGTRLYVYLHGDGVNTVYVEVLDSSNNVVYNANYPADVNQTIFIDAAPGSYTVNIYHVDPQTGASSLYQSFTVTVESESGLIQRLVDTLINTAKGLISAVIPQSLLDFATSVIDILVSLVSVMATLATTTLKLLTPLIVLGIAASFISNPIATIETIFEYTRKIIQIIANIINTLIPI